MNRIFVIFCPIAFIALLALAATTEQRNSVSFSWDVWAVHFIAMLLCVLGAVVYCGFAGLHAMQHLESPADRSTWFIAIVAGNLLGACCYLLTIYQTFRKNGRGRLMSFQKNKIET